MTTLKKVSLSRRGPGRPKKSRGSKRRSAPKKASRSRRAVGRPKKSRGSKRRSVPKKASRSRRAVGRPKKSRGSKRRSATKKASRSRRSSKRTDKYVGKVVSVRSPKGRFDYKWIVDKREDGRYVVRTPKIGTKIRDLKLKRDNDYGKPVLLDRDTKIRRVL